MAQPEAQPSSSDGSHLVVESESPRDRTSRVLTEFASAERNAYAAYKEAIRPYAQRVVEGLDAEIDWYVKNVRPMDNPANVDMRHLQLEFEGITKEEFLRTDLVGIYDFVDESNAPGNLILEKDGRCRLEAPDHPDWTGTWSVEENEVVLKWEHGSGTHLISVPRLWGDWKYFNWVKRTREE